MARHVLDYDPITGVTEYFDYDHATQRVILSHEQDVSKALDLAAELRADKDRTRNGMKTDFLHYAIVPPVIQLEMKQKHGVNFWDKKDDAKTYALLNDEYSRFKVTEIHHSVKRSGR
jgi:hypothetical protein